MIRGSRTYFALAALLALLAVMVPSRSTSASKPPCIPTWHDGTIVFFTVTNVRVADVGKAGNTHMANPFYAFGPPPNAPQFDVISKIQGPGYSPWWEVFAVIPLDGRNVSTNPFTSEQEILDAQAAHKVLIIDTDFVFLCQVLPSCSN